MNEEGSNRNKSFTNIILKASSLILLFSIISKFFGFLFNSLLTKSISQTDYGSYTFAWQIAMFAGLMLLGVFPSIARHIAYYRGKEDNIRVGSVIKTGFLIVLFLTIASLIILVVANTVFPFLLFLDKPLMAFVLAVFVIQTIGSFFSNVISGYGKPEICAVYTTLFTVLSFLFVFAAVYAGYSFLHILLAILMAFLIVNIGSALYELKNFGIGGKADFLMAKELLYFGIPLVLIDGSNAILSWANLYIIKFFYGFSDVGIFWAVTITSNIILLFSQSILSIFTPIAAEIYGRRDLGKLAFMSSYLFERFLLFSSPILLIFLVFPEGILKIIFTEDYASGAVPFQILSISVFLSGLSMLFRTVITASGKPLQEARIIFIAAIINIILNIILIKSYGLAGASVAMLISSLIILLFSFKYSRNLTKIIVYKDRLIKIGVSLFIALVSVYIVKIGIPNLIVAFVLSVLVLLIFYIGCLLVLKTFRSEDIVVLKLILDNLPLPERMKMIIINNLEKGIS